MKRFALVLIVLLAAGVFASAVLADTPPPTDTTTTTITPPPAVVPTGVTLAGVQIGGLAPDVAAAAVLEAFEQPVTLHFDKTTISVSPNLLGMTVPTDAAVADERARDHPWIEALLFTHPSPARRIRAAQEYARAHGIGAPG